MAHDKMIVLTLRGGTTDEERARLLLHLEHKADQRSPLRSVFRHIESVQVRPFEPLVKPDGE